MNFLGESGPHARAALLLAASVAAVFADAAALVALLAAAVALLALAAPRRLVVLALALGLTAVVYGLVVLAAGGEPRVVVLATGRFALPFATALAVTALTPPGRWLLLAPGSRAVTALAATLAVLPGLSRDVEALRDAARMRGYGRIEGAFRAVPAAFVRTLRRGRLADEALAQTGHPSPRRVVYDSHSWTLADAAVLAVAAFVAGVALA